MMRWTTWGIWGIGGYNRKDGGCAGLFAGTPAPTGSGLSLNSVGAGVPAKRPVMAKGYRRFTATV
ncbi:hypothetical protein DV532_00500 [Pseudomonas sp. Leaf58]|nr:hypothetical protein DV532_00500 [Pseudomonas sp. Leaf58]